MIPEGKKFLNYIVTDKGELYSLYRHKYLTPTVMKNGYVMYSIKGHASRQLYAHRIVAEAFGLATNCCIDHIDGDKSNNSISNLRAASYSENELYKNTRINGAIYATDSYKTYGPFYSVKSLYEELNVQGTLGSVYSAVSVGHGYGYTFYREKGPVQSEQI